MKTKLSSTIYALFLIGILCCLPSCKNEKSNSTDSKEDPLPSFNQGQVKQNIIDFVKKVSTQGNAEYVAPENRIVCFDNDGTLWAEQPLPSQLYFSFDQIKSLAKDHPEFSTTMPYKAILENDIDALKKQGVEPLLHMVGLVDSLQNNQYSEVVNNWMENSMHPTLKTPFNKTIYQPMMELLDYLRAHQFTIYIVSGGGQKFMRAWQPHYYKVEEENVIGSTFQLKSVQQGDSIAIVPTTIFEFLDDHMGKPINIEKFIGKKPIMIVGNSDGDLEMMEYATTENTLPTLMVFLNHDDAKREFDYSQGVMAGSLVKGKEEALKRGWTIISMKNDWNTVFVQ